MLPSKMESGPSAPATAGLAWILERHYLTRSTWSRNTVRGWVVPALSRQVPHRIRTSDPHHHPQKIEDNGRYKIEGLLGAVCMEEILRIDSHVT